MYLVLKEQYPSLNDVPRYTSPFSSPSSRYKEIPFEDVIFEESGFLTADKDKVITVRVASHVEVSFPADTDLSVVIGFISKMRKEAVHVGT